MENYLGANFGNQSLFLHGAASFCEVIAGYYHYHRYQYLFINLSSQYLFYQFCSKSINYNCQDLFESTSVDFCKVTWPTIIIIKLIVPIICCCSVFVVAIVIIVIKIVFVAIKTVLACSFLRSNCSLRSSALAPCAKALLRLGISQNSLAALFWHRFDSLRQFLGILLKHLNVVR